MKDESYSIIMLDWDRITINEAKRRISLIKNTQWAKSVEIKMSPLNGYHVYVYLFHPVDEQTSYKLRRWWKDDGRRLMIDVFWKANSGKDTANVMFTQKFKYKMIWSEVPLFLYQRKTINSEWLVTNQQESAKKSLLQLQQEYQS